MLRLPWALQGPHRWHLRPPPHHPAPPPSRWGTPRPPIGLQGASPLHLQVYRRRAQATRQVTCRILRQRSASCHKQVGSYSFHSIATFADSTILSSFLIISNFPLVLRLELIPLHAAAWLFCSPLHCNSIALRLWLFDFVKDKKEQKIVHRSLQKCPCMNIISTSYIRKPNYNLPACYVEPE